MGSGSSSSSSLTAGNYFVTTTDSVGCINIQLLEIAEPAILTSAITSISESVAGLTGSASVAAAGGTVPYSYSWNGGETTATAVTLPSGTVWVTVTDVNGCISVGNVSIPTTISELNQITKLKIYPNPTDGRVMISAAIEITSITVYNPVGQVIINHKINSWSSELDFSAQNNGVYFAAIVTKNGILIRKILVQ
ncbi:MAG: T9SS type A sorting domain-containing protein [Flavobacteriales bacterium]|nr:T9SS type A sorting domain-containing protein [Flavobacteriales bacterium]